MAKATKKTSTIPGRAQFASTIFSGKGNAQVNTIPTIEAGRTKHGPGRRSWGQREFARAAKGVLYPDGLPTDISRKFKAQLVRDVRKLLNEDPFYRGRHFRRIGRNTVLRAAGLLR
jgi:hypothetical protein